LKGLPETNALAYLALLSMTNIKNLIKTQTLGVSVIGHFFFIADNEAK
jgi:hypothetical protein